MTVKVRIWLANKFIKNNLKKIIIPLLITSFIMIFSISFNKMINNYIYNGIMLDQMNNSFFIDFAASGDDEDKALSKIKKIEHISDAYVDIESHYSLYLTKIGNSKVNGSFFIYGSTNNLIPNLISGRLPLNKNEIVCPRNFFPSDNIEGNRFIKKKQVINLEDSVDLNFETNYSKFVDIETSKSEKQYLTFKLVGIYENNKNYIDENICYSSHEIVKEIFNNAYINYDLSNQINSIIVKLDNINNYEAVKEKISALGYSITSAFVLNEALLYIFKYVAIIISVISMIITFIVVFNINIKMIIDKTKDYGILKAIGFNNQELSKLLNIETFIIFVFYTIITLLVSYGILFLIKLFIYQFPFVFQKIPIAISVQSIIVSWVSVFLIIYISKLFYRKKLMNKIISFEG